MATQYPNLLTYAAKISQVELINASPVAVIPPAFTSPIATTYGFLSNVAGWTDNNNPPSPQEDQYSLKQTFNNMFVLKLITSNDISPVIRRIDWTSGVTYDYYQDNIDMFQLDSYGNYLYTFYVKNRYDQVFKCLWNNNGTPSTIEPYFEPGTYGSNPTTPNIFQGGDGYKWKFMYTIDSGSKIKFMDSTWIPVPLVQAVVNVPAEQIGAGDIEVINVTNGGSGYDPANAAITVTITGDGIGATGTAVVENGQISDIIVTNVGAGYSYATVSITSAIGSNATAVAYASPIYGHSFDPPAELGNQNIMFTCEFNGSEGGNIPTDITYYQVGLLINPSALDSYPLPANNNIYQLSTNVVVAPGFGTYTLTEQVYQGDSTNPSFVGTVLDFDPAGNVIRIINTLGTITQNAPIFGYTSKTTRTVLSSTLPNYVPYSGYISYIENRSGITRSVDGIEQFKFVLGY